MFTGMYHVNLIDETFTALVIMFPITAFKI